MADLDGLHASGSVKIAGALSSGEESHFVNASSTGDLKTSDIINTSGIYGTITVGTSAVALRVGGSNLTERKLLTVDNTSNTTLYWGYNNSVTTSSYAGRIFKDQQASWTVGPNVTIYLIASTAGNNVHCSEAS